MIGQLFSASAPPAFLYILFYRDFAFRAARLSRISRRARLGRFRLGRLRLSLL